MRVKVCKITTQLQFIIIIIIIIIIINQQL